MAGLACRIRGETIPTGTPGTLSMTIHQLVCVIFTVVLWNGPVVLAACAIASPLVCSTAKVLRPGHPPAGFAPGTGNGINQPGRYGV